MNGASPELLLEMVQGGKGAVRRLERAQILLAADRGSNDEEIARNVAVGDWTLQLLADEMVRLTVHAKVQAAA